MLRIKGSVLQSVILACAALMIAGCEVGADYQKPADNPPSGWISDEAKQMSDKAELDQVWWKNFNDPVLNTLIDKASSNNFDLKIAEARITEARANVSSTFANLLPQGDIKGTATREANQIAFPDANASGLGSLLHKPFNLFQTGFDASWELDLFGGNRRADESAEAQFHASEASRDDVLVSLLAEVARTYIDIRQNQALLAATNDIIAADKKTVAIAQQRFNVGDAPRLDVTQGESALENAQTQLPAIRTQLTQAEFSLDVLLGEQPGASRTLVEAAAAIPTSNKALVLNAPSKVIAQRPDIRMAERRLASATAQQGVALAKFFPDISLTGFFGALNTSTSKLLTGSNQSWMAGGSVIWPILSYGSLSANLDAANAQQQEAMATYQKTVISALADVEKSLNAYTEQAQFLQSALNENGKNIKARDIALERYQVGLTSFIDVLDAERTLYQSQTQLVQARASYAQDLVALYKSLGGGWAKN